MTATLARSEDGLAADVAALSGQNLFACYQCGKCTAGCPFSFSPQRVMRHLQLGQVDEAIGLATVWECASCFTCTTACPKGVDPARVLKTLRTLPREQVMRLAPAAQRTVKARRRAHRSRAWLIANNHRLARVGSRLAPVSNWLLNAPGAGLVSHYALGVHRNRSLPPFAAHGFQEWFRAHEPLGDGHRGTVLLFHDTFMDYNFPETGVAATELLEQAGFHVEPTDSVCCGRPMISKGFLDQAAVQARENVRRLFEPAKAGTWIVGCEPSCLLTLRDDYPKLVHDSELEEQARVVARQSLLIDEFLAMLAREGELELRFRQAEDGDAPPRVLFHAHCHQKAHGTPSASLELLRLAGYDAELVNTACCGMAGAFGYEKEHYELSRAAGERGLFPAVRAADGAEVVVMGVSCRQQLEHFLDRRPLHLAQAVRDAVQ